MSRRFDKLDQIRHAALSSSAGGAVPGTPDDQDESQRTSSVPSTPNMAFVNNNNNNVRMASPAGRLEELKQKEAELAKQLAAVRMEKLSALRSKPLTIGIIGFGRFGQFIARTFAKHGRVVVTSRSDYTEVADAMGAKYVPLDDMTSFLQEDLDVVILATSIVSFESTVQKLVPSLKKYVESGNKGPLVVDVLSVKEHARQIMLEKLPEECDILCTHPMFGPDSGKNGWHNLNFVYEKTRVDKVVFDHDERLDNHENDTDTFRDNSGTLHSIHEDNEAHIEAMDRIERFLSIWEEEGCRMVPMSCKSHDEYAANSQFITHLMGRILGAQGLSKTPIDTKGFESVLKLIDSTTADSFDLFYGLYKYNQKNSLHTIKQLQAAMEDVVENLQLLEQEDMKKQQRIHQQPKK
ncbi:prephenate dehydrogenase [Nitzschia inconspicua]|uniref:Prephenate dehydrogenase n=1 Tax=Nitzschia inconspicua TaxID=303405 RepID=A0A9K3LFF0_9STRA|nr:prephenate dehydrogenase [Nitzschia inconspicua]